MNKKKILYLLRNKINNIDYKIIQLLSNRESISIDILKYKISHQFDVRDKNREIELFQNLKKYSKKNQINQIFIKKLFHLIIKNSISIQEFYKKTILSNKKKYYCAYLGPTGSYSYIAFNILNQKYKKNFLSNEFFNFSSIISALKSDICQFALLPLENRISGIIPEVYDILKKQDKIYIVKEISVKIQHQLLSTKNCFFYKIKNIYSHIQPFKQCSIFLEKFPEWKKHYFNSTSEAMKALSLNKKADTAVIGSSIGGSFYNLKKISANISNKENNITRFILISKKEKKIPDDIHAKTTMLLTLNRHQHNNHKILKILKKMNIKVINMILEPNSKNKKEKTYFIEIQENKYSKIMQNALSCLHEYTKKIKILGCYAIEKK